MVTVQAVIPVKTGNVTNWMKPRPVVWKTLTVGVIAVTVVPTASVGLAVVTAALIARKAVVIAAKSVMAVNVKTSQQLLIFAVPINVKVFVNMVKTVLLMLTAIVTAK